MIKRATAAVLGGLLLTAASKPLLPPEVYFPEGSPTASSKIAAMCMDAKYSVLASDDHQVVCSKQMSGFGGIMTQLVLGNAYSTTPQQSIRFQMIAWGTGTRVQFSAWAETQMPFGQIQRAPLNGRKITQELLTALYSRGATVVPISPAAVSPVGAQAQSPMALTGDKGMASAASAGMISGGIGVGFIPAPAGIVIMAVAPGSAAEAAGFKTGQVIQSVNGIDLRGMPSEAVATVIKGQTLPATFMLAGGGKLKVAGASLGPKTEASIAPLSVGVAQAQGARLIDLGSGVKLVPANTLSGYCIKAESTYIGTGSASAPAITTARPLCT